MKTVLNIFFVLLSLQLIAGGEVNKLNIGDEAVLTDVKMLSVSGEKVSVEEAKKENGVLVLFSCNTCPFVLRWEDRYNEIKKLADKKGFGMLVLNSNYQKRSGADSFEAMKEHANDKNYNFKYVVDKDSRIANAYGGQTTPHAFLFDNKMKLVYKGAIDDNHKSASAVEKEFLKEAMNNIAEGETVKLEETQPVGCSIKRKLD